jgi:hypothetical protein
MQIVEIAFDIRKEQAKKWLIRITSFCIAAIAFFLGQRGS